MKVQVIQHVDFEDPGYITDVCESSGFLLRTSKIFMGEEIPAGEEFDMLLIMGGPMSANDDKHYPWLTKEKRAIEEALKKDKLVFGFCLGAQLIAHVLGSKVIRSPFSEIGWFPVKKETPPDVLGFLPDVVTVFHWHGETFGIPGDGIRLYSSQVVPNQAFIYGDNVLAMQFHPEITARGVSNLIRYCGEELKEDAYIMHEEALRTGYQRHFRAGHNMVAHLFRYFTRNRTEL